MGYKNLGAFIERLEKENELVRVRTGVSSELEITEIADRAVKSGGPALLFENVEGSAFPVLVNSFASEKRMAIALELERLDDLQKKVENLFGLVDNRPGTLWEKIKTLPKLAEIGRFFPRTAKTGPCKEVIKKGEQVNLSELPVLKCWPDDAGPFVTLPMVFTRDPETGARNVGMYRMQVFDRNTTGMHWHRHKDGARHYDGYSKKKGRMDVAVAIGADPAMVFASTVPLPEDLDETALAGFLSGEPVSLVKAETSDLLVPAEAEFVLEGYVTPGETRIEGPFGDHTGFYSAADEYPVFHVECVTHRKNPVYHATIVGKPPMEDCFMGLATEKLFLPVLRRMHPEIVDFHMPFEGIFHNLVLVSIDKRYPGQARKIMHSLWGAGQAQFSKVIVVVDADVDIRDYSTLAWKALNNIDPQRDMEIAVGAIDVLDHASREPGFGSKIGIDATRKMKEEGFHRPWPEEIEMSREIKKLVEERWKDYGIPGAGF